jgi:hypothetical protein
MDIAYQQYIKLVSHHLGKRKNISASLPFLVKFPELLDIYAGELTAAINLFSRYRQTDSLRDRKLFPNAEKIIEILGDDSLPLWEDAKQELAPNPDPITANKLNAIFEEVGQFQFPDWNGLTSLETLGTLFITYYRTFTLVTWPHLRTAGAMVGSTTEEMLALMAVNGVKTLLFSANKIWMLRFAEEGFSPEMADSIKHL